MKQPEDTKTINLLDGEKRGRGRPRKDDALTPAERAKRYRDKKRSSVISSDVTKNENNGDVTKNQRDADFWHAVYEAQLERTVELESRIAAGKGNTYTYAQITEITENRIIEFMSRAATEADSRTASQLRSWAYGAYLGWVSLTQFRQADGDDKKLADLCSF